MRALELRVPPPVVAVVTGLVMWFVSHAAPSLVLAIPARNAFAIALAALGVATAISGVTAFARARTTVNPMKPGSSTSLVISGIYKTTRNPMYLGLLLVLTGWAVNLSNALAFVWLPAFVAYISRFQIAPEERTLTSLFGEEFTAYQSRVRRWI